MRGFTKTSNHGFMKAFTLVELLVAVSIATLLMVLIFMLHEQTVRVWNQTDSRIGASRQAAVFQQILSADLAQIVPLSGLPTLSTMNIGPISGRKGAKSAAQIHLIASLADDERGDICAVSYSSEYDPALGGWAIFRRVIPGHELLARAGFGAEPRFVPTVEKLFSRQEEENPAERVAAYIWNVDIQFFDASGEPVDPSLNTFDSGMLPASVGVEFTSVEATAARVQAAKSEPSEFWDHPSSHFYRRTVGESAIRRAGRFPIYNGLPLRHIEFPEPTR